MTATATAGQPAARGVLDSVHRPMTVGLLLIVSTVAFEAMAVATALPAITADLGGLRLYGWAFSAFMLASLVTAVVAGGTADRRGPALPLAAGMTLFAAGLLLAGFAPSMLVFVGGRALQGAGGGAISGMAYVAISRGYPEQLRARMLALLSSAWVLPALVGPAAAGVVSEHLTWRLVLLGLLPLPLLAAVLVLPPLRRLGRPQAVAPAAGRVRPALLLSAGTALALAGVAGGSWWLGPPLMVAGVALAVPAFLRLMPAGIATARAGLPAGMAARGLLTFAFFGAEAFVPLGLTEMRGLSTALAGVPLTASALTWTAGSWLQERLDRRDGGHRRAWRVAVGFALILAGVALTAAGVLVGAITVWLAPAAWAVAGLGMGLAYSTITLLVMGHSPAGQEGAIASSLQVTEQLAFAVSAGLGGGAVSLAVALGHGEGPGIAAAFVVAGFAGLLGLSVARRLQP